MSEHKNFVRMSVSGTPGTGTITLGSAVSGYQSLATAYGANATVDVSITDGTAWEVARDCTYTHSGTTLTRGTLEESSTGSALSLTSAAVVTVTATAEFGRRMESAALNHVAGSDADTTMAVGNLYVVDMSAWATANRTFTLPATAAVGDRVGVMVSAGSASYELLLTAASGDTLNAVAGGTEWSRLFITGEVVIIRCVAANATWVVDVDGRIPQVGRMGLTANITTSTGGAWNATDFDETLIQVGCVVTTSGAGTSKIKVRRTGNYIISGASLTVTNLVDTEAFGWACTANGNVGTGTILCAFSANRASGATQGGTSGVIAAPANAGDLLQHNFYNASTANAGLRGLNYASNMAVVEVL